MRFPVSRPVATCLLAALIPLSALAQAPAPAPAKAPARLTAHDFFRHPQFNGVALSPDGETLAATAPVNDRMVLVTLNLKERKPVVVATVKDFDVVQFQWVNNTRLVFSLGNINEPSASERRTGGGLFAINKDGSDARTLAPTARQAIAAGSTVYRQMFFVGRSPELSDEVIAAANERSVEQTDVYRVNTVTGRKTLLTFENPGRAQGWVIDRAGNVRAAVSGDDDNRLTTWYRKDGEGPWQKLAEYNLWEKNTLPLAFGYDGTFYVISNEGRDKYAIYTYDVEKKARGNLVFEHPDVDVGVSDLGVGPDPGKLIFDNRSRKLVGIRYHAEKPGVKWLDAGWEDTAVNLQRAAGDLVIDFSPPQYSDRAIITGWSDRHSGSWFLFDRKTGKLELLVPKRSWLRQADMVEMKPVRYMARDGLEIPAYLFLPKGSGGKKMPLVVNIHGGPIVRADLWGLEMWGPIESQFLAYNGYAVLLPNFRGTPGFGHRHVVSSLRQWNKAMQEDLEDGVDHLVKEGIVDGARVCLYGASYGGYATLMSLAKTPDKYRCGVAALVVSDLALQLNSSRTDFGTNKAALNYWYSMVGNPSTEADIVREASPVTHAAKVKASLFIVAGEDDRRTPLEQAEVMRAALRKAGKEPEWMVKPEEGHGFAKVENRVDLYTAMLKFFDKHIGPGVK